MTQKAVPGVSGLVRARRGGVTMSTSHGHDLHDECIIADETVVEVAEE